MGEDTRQEKHLVFKNKGAGLYKERTDSCNYVRMAGVSLQAELWERIRMEKQPAASWIQESVVWSLFYTWHGGH